jgi:hypothetical protein
MIQQTVAWQPADQADKSFCCMIRLGIIAHRFRVLPMVRKLGKAIDKAANDAMANHTGLLQSERIAMRWNHYGYLQYWRSVDEMLAWAHAQPHTDWWKQAVERQRTKQDLSIYHETYLVSDNSFEAIYMNPGNWRPGASKFGNLVMPKGRLATARGRLGELGESRPSGTQKGS